MSFANFGIGVGALAQGLSTGMDIGQKFNKVRDQKQIRDAMKGGMENAKAAREKAVGERISVGSASNADNTATVPTFNVDGVDYADEKQARGAADKAVGSVMDFFYQNEAPRVAELYASQGDIQTAETWNKWIKDKNVQKGFEFGVRAFQSAQTGDDEGAVKNMIKMYNQPGYFEDGRKATGYELIKNKSGETTGYAITVKGADGKEQVLNVNKGEDMLNAVQRLADPQAVFKQGLAEIQSAREARLAMAKGELDHARNLEVAQVKANSAAGMENLRQSNRLERDGINAQRQAVQPTAIEQKATGLMKVGESLGMSGEALKQFVAAGVGAKSEDDFVKMATGLLSKQQDLYGNNKFLSLPPDQQQQQIQQLANTIKAARGAQQPMAGGIPAQGQPAMPRGATIIDTKTGQVVPMR